MLLETTSGAVINDAGSAGTVITVFRSRQVLIGGFTVTEENGFLFYTGFTINGSTEGNRGINFGRCERCRAFGNTINSVRRGIGVGRSDVNLIENTINLIVPADLRSRFGVSVRDFSSAGLLTTPSIMRARPKIDSAWVWRPGAPARSTSTFSGLPSLLKISRSASKRGTTQQLLSTVILGPQTRSC